MKGFKILFAACLGLLAFRATGATYADDAARAASRRDAISPVNQQQNTSARSRQKTVIPSTQQKTNVGTRTGAGRTGGANSSVREKTISSQSARTTTSGRTSQTRGTSSREGIVRTTTERASGDTKNVSRTIRKNSGSTTRTRQSVPGTLTRGNVHTKKSPAISGRNATSKPSTRISRTATNVTESGALMANYSRCRTVFNQCMDEFCANKDSQLKRCACSSRVNEFNGIKKQLAKVEDKMLDFNQRLLAVNMDAEDVKAMITASEGEDAFYDTKDTTKSKKMLDDIAKKLNKTFNSKEDSIGMGAISLSLNEDMAFDNIDSFGGITTTTKTGTALYRDALPICQEMALEVCSEEELNLAESGYQMQIEQDCTTIQKSYQTQVDQARNRVHESSALLDMSRLDIYQKRNSDDILTCKKKMLDMLADVTICGKNMEKCLDMSGKYIDPTTGEVFLTNDLANLSNLIVRPGDNQKWSNIPENKPFITFLNSKKTLLEPATENCQVIAGSIWSDFLEDALAKIKLAQEAKLEQVRQACTSINSQCINEATESINNFDARALSVFGVSADYTVNSMCSNVRTSCSNLLSDTDWGTGVSNLVSTKTFETILSSCTQVGKNCIIESCRSMSSNFGLCEDIQLSPNRHSILQMISCWDQVLTCVSSAGKQETQAIMDMMGISDFYGMLYAPGAQHYDICQADCNGDSETCAECRIAERIWGNCEKNPSSANEQNNKIVVPIGDTETLMSWFAENTKTAGNASNCSISRCVGNIAIDLNGQSVCVVNENDITSGDNLYCPAPHVQIQVTSALNNCCESGHVLGDVNRACCDETVDNGDGLCLPTDVSTHSVLLDSGNYKLVCLGTTSGDDTTSNFPNGQTVMCNGTIIKISDDNKYTLPTSSDASGHYYTPRMYYYQNQERQTKTDYDGTDTDVTSWFIGYQQQ
ncbi:MAG: hypothetical protein K5912_03810 [Alphaproteobacteria bacterium]|nr:hypothetical protein [Alphaproteobacteria bacterium]